MGNRATVIFTDGNGGYSPAVYLHWNGGPESVYGFLEELDRRGVRADQEYECARFIQIVGEFFDQDHLSTLSLGVSNGPADHSLKGLEAYDPGDNGVFLVNRTGKTPNIRRFVSRWIASQSVFEEMTPAQAQAERQEAERHAYGMLRATFAKLTAGKLTESAHMKVIVRKPATKVLSARFAKPAAS